MAIIPPPGPTYVEYKAQARVITPPSGFAWPFATYPMNVFGSSGRFSTDINPRLLVNAAIWASTSFIHVTPTGNDTTAAVVSSPTNTATPALSIAKAIQLGNATGGAFRVLIKGGIYGRTQSIRGNGSTQEITQHCSLEGYGGRVITGVFPTGADVVWANDGSGTNTFTASRSNVQRAFDVRTLNAYGDYTELPLVASLAACQALPGSWYQAAGQTPLYVHLADGATVTNSNARVYLGSSLENLKLTSAKDIYLSGIDLEGGMNGCIWPSLVNFSNQSLLANVVAEDCTFKYAGSIAAPIDGVRLDNIDGIVAFFRCGAAANSKDGFNFHWSRNDIASRIYPITVDCWSRDNGRGTSTSNNGWTAHDAITGIDINGVYSGNYGANLHVITGCQQWCVGTTVENSQGDVGMGGVIPSAGFVVGQNGDVLVNSMWLDSTLARGCLLPIWVHNAVSAVRTRGHRSSGGVEAVDAGGILATY